MSAQAVDAAPAAALQVRLAGQADAAQWDAFVGAAPGATFFHRFAWRSIIEQVFGHRAHFLLASRGGRIVGILPLAHMRSLLFGSSLISTPFCVYGGAVGEDAGVCDALAEAAGDLGRRLGVDYVELRNREPQRADWPTKHLYVTFRKPISADDEQNLREIPRKQRAVVRAGIAAGLQSVVDEDTGRLWSAYSESVRNLGTPVFPRRYFQALREAFGADCEVLSIVKDGELLAGVMSFYFRDEVLPYYGGGTRAARAHKANDFMYWEVMRRAAARGVRVFDYGRSKKGSGSYDFKRHWGFPESQLHYQYHLVKAAAVPDVSPNNPKYRALAGLWKRLPLPVSRVVGPVIARHLG